MATVINNADLRFTLNVCPYCAVALDYSERPPVYPLCAIAVCGSCGHVIAYGLSKDGRDVEVGKMTHEWLHREFDEPTRKRIREVQERTLVKLGLGG